MKALEPGHGIPLLLLGWLLIGQPWADVDSWEELTLRGKPFVTRLACEHIWLVSAPRLDVGRPQGGMGPAASPRRPSNITPRSFIYDAL